MKYHKDSILCRLQYIEESGELYEGEIKEEYAGRTNYYNVNPDPRIEGYGKMTYPNGKVVMGYWSRGKALRYITIRPNGKRDFVCMNLEDEDSYTYNQVYFTKDHSFIPGGHRKNNTNNWSEDVLNDILEIEDIIKSQQDYLKDLPILTTKMGDGWYMDTMVSTVLKSKNTSISSKSTEKRVNRNKIKVDIKSKGDFSVVLEKLGNEPLATIKLIREILGTGLAETKKMVDKIPVTIASEIDSKSAMMLKNEFEKIGNVVFVSGLDDETKVKNNIVEMKVEGNRIIADEHIPTELENALARIYELIGREAFLNGERVCNLLGDIIPKLEKERRRVKLAYSANAICALIDEKDKNFAINEAVKRLVDYSDMDESVAKATIITIYEIIK